MDLPLHSVCIPAYNHERYILACLESVRDQTYPRLELIVVDDGSRDRTAELVESFLERHGRRFERAVLLRQQNRGIAPTCNRLLELARGEWMHVLGSDDRFHPHKIEEEWKACRRWGENDLALVHADAELIDADGRIIGPHLSSWRKEGPVRDAVETLLLNNYIKAPTVMFRRTALLELGGYDEDCKFEDYYSWLKIASRFPIGKINRVVCAYRWHGGNYSADEGIMLKETIRIHGKFVRNFGDEIGVKTVMKCYRKDARRVWRRVKRENGKRLPAVTLKLLKGCFSSADHRRFEELVREL